LVDGLLLNDSSLDKVVGRVRRLPDQIANEEIGIAVLRRGVEVPQSLKQILDQAAFVGIHRSKSFAVAVSGQMHGRGAPWM
jgi:hypothetical protein